MSRLVVWRMPDVCSVLGVTTFARSHHRLPCNLFAPPAPHRMPIGSRFKHRPGLSPTHRLRITASWAERAPIRRIERIGKIATGRP